ncbi:MAG: hypothetical protein IJ773_09000, partial [Lachnospiraceae bacterium]|nr:hypothetical protein [Lachnospiraceae bacterium]
MKNAGNLPTGRLPAFFFMQNSFWKLLICMGLGSIGLFPMQNTMICRKTGKKGRKEALGFPEIQRFVGKQGKKEEKKLLASLKFNDLSENREKRKRRSSWL